MQVVQRPPGPSGGRWSGNLPDFAVDPLEFLTRCQRDFGDVVELGSGNYLVTHPDDIDTVLADRDGCFAKLRPDGTGRSSGFARAMMNSEGADWRRKRTRLQPVFRNSRLTAHKGVVSRLVERSISGWRVGEIIDVHKEMSRITLSTATAVLLGQSLRENEVAAIEEAVRAIMRLTSSPVRLPSWVPSPTNVLLKRALRRLDRSLDAIVSEREAGSTPPLNGAHSAHPADADPEPADVLSLLLAVRPRLDRREIVDELATLLMSGYETSADALSWLVFCVYSDADLLARVRKPVLIDPESKEAEDMVSACVKECLRLWPPAWITTREAIAIARLRDYVVPAGTTVALSPWVTHRDPRWYKHPKTYLPERWLDPGHRPRYAYFPFGGGERACIGMSLAMRELQIATTRLLCSTDLKLVDPEKVRPRPALALQPVGLRAEVRITSSRGSA